MLIPLIQSAVLNDNRINQFDKLEIVDCLGNGTLPTALIGVVAAESPDACDILVRNKPAKFVGETDGLVTVAWPDGGREVVESYEVKRRA